ncbi:MAG: hypothetical protein QOJ09_2443 [Actinomycetota bacterium]|nr:hypothetical protein [Actinomycetota bacterium]
MADVVGMADGVGMAAAMWALTSVVVALVVGPVMARAGRHDAALAAQLVGGVVGAAGIEPATERPFG